MASYGYFDDSEEFRVTVSTTFDRKQFGELELVGTLMQYKEQQKDYWDRIGVGGSIVTACALWKDLLLFGACDRNLYCLDMDGHEKWKFRTNGVILGHSMVHDGAVFFESSDGCIYAVECETGKLLWKFPTNGRALGHLAVSNGVVYGGSWDKNVYALDEKTGKELWRIPTVGAQTGIGEKDGVLYFGYIGGVFYAYDIKARRQLWTFRTQKDASGWEPAFWGDNVYIGSFEGNTYAINRRNGELAWKFSASDSTYAAMAFGKRLYFGSNDFNAYCLDAETGRLLWKFRTSGLVNYAVESEGRAYFGSYDSNVYCADAASGREIWRFRTNGFVNYVRVHGNLVTFGSWDCNMYCVDARTGRLIWKFKTSLGTPSQIEPPETGIVRSAEVVWSAPEEELSKARPKENQISDYGAMKSEYVSSGMGDYMGKKKRGYV